MAVPPCSRYAPTPAQEGRRTLASPLGGDSAGSPDVGRVRTPLRARASKRAARTRRGAKEGTFLPLRLLLRRGRRVPHVHLRGPEQQAVALHGEALGHLRVVALALAVQLPVVLLVDQQLQGLLRVPVVRGDRERAAVGGHLDEVVRAANLLPLLEHVLQLLVQGLALSGERPRAALLGLLRQELVQLVRAA